MVHDRPWSVVADGIMIVIRLSPQGGHDTMERIARLAAAHAVVKARVRAPPSDRAATPVQRPGLPP
jgi:uncharacterized protein YggU (UPF0235/DUF167 family)